jgi:hypothetical protein
MIRQEVCGGEQGESNIGGRKRKAPFPVLIMRNSAVSVYCYILDVIRLENR